METTRTVSLFLTSCCAWRTGNKGRSLQWDTDGNKVLTRILIMLHSIQNNQKAMTLDTFYIASTMKPNIFLAGCKAPSFSWISVLHAFLLNGLPYMRQTCQRSSCTFLGIGFCTFFNHTFYFICQTFDARKNAYLLAAFGVSLKRMAPQAQNVFLMQKRTLLNVFTESSVVHAA